jgi:hypothetical protein
MAATATTVSASGSTGSTCLKTGPYKSSRHTSIIIFMKSGTKFPADPVDSRSTTWSMVGATGTQTTL